MSESIVISEGNKAEKYQSLLPQVTAIIDGEPDLIANMANMTAALKMQFGWWWVGFYLVKGSELVLGPFQGPIACTRIRKGKGVCGTAWADNAVLRIDNVNVFPGHIACSSASQSEIVLPVVRQGEVIAVLDIDSEKLDHFDDIDQQYLIKFVQLLEQTLSTRQ